MLFLSHLDVHECTKMGLIYTDISIITGLKSMLGMNSQHFN